MSDRSERKKKVSRFSEESKDTSFGSGNVKSPTVVDRDRCPRGWDEDIWHLVLLFGQKAERDQVYLRAGRPVIYSELDHRISESKIRAQKVPYSSADLQEMFHGIRTVMSRRFVNVEVYELSGPLWRRFVELMITEFWCYVFDPSVDVLSVFCSVTNPDHGLGFKDLWDTLVSRLDAR